MMNTIIERLDKVILDGIDGKTPLDLNDETDLIEDLYFDSINIISLIVSIEKEFSIEIPDEFLVLEKLRSYHLIKNEILGILNSQNNLKEQKIYHEIK